MAFFKWSLKRSEKCDKENVDLFMKSIDCENRETK